MAESILAFLAFRPQLLHRIDPQHNNWPSPRSWTMANALLRAELDIAPAVGEAAAGEFCAFCAVYKDLPDLDAIVAGNPGQARFLVEPSARYAIILGLVMRARAPEQAANALRWLVGKAGPEWLQLFFADVFRTLREQGTFGEFARIAGQDAGIKAFLAENRNLMSGAA